MDLMQECIQEDVGWGEYLDCGDAGSGDDEEDLGKEGLMKEEVIDWKEGVMLDDMKGSGQDDTEDNEIMEVEG